jgi:transposase InsO family protein
MAAGCDALCAMSRIFFTRYIQPRVVEIHAEADVRRRNCLLRLRQPPLTALVAAMPSRGGESSTKFKTLGRVFGPKGPAKVPSRYLVCDELTTTA